MTAATSLQDLLAVQDLDISMDQLRHRRGHLPERAEIAALDERIGVLARELAEVDVVLGELRGRQSSAEADLAATEERSAAVNGRMYGGTVSASRDLQAMSVELDHLKARASALEDAVLELLEAAEPLEQRAGELRSSLSALGDERAALEVSLTSAEEELDGEISAVAGRRPSLAAAVPEGLLSTYEKLRARLGGVGVARVVGNHCDGCHLTLSAMELDRVRHLPEGEVYTCEQCARILVP